MLTIDIDLEVPLEKTEYKIRAGYINLQQLLQGHTLTLENSLREKFAICLTN